MFKGVVPTPDLEVPDRITQSSRCSLVLGHVGLSDSEQVGGGCPCWKVAPGPSYYTSHKGKHPKEDEPTKGQGKPQGRLTLLNRANMEP